MNPKSDLEALSASTHGYPYDSRIARDEYEQVKRCTPKQHDEFVRQATMFEKDDEPDSLIWGRALED